MIKLQQVFTDFQIIVQGKGQMGRYPQTFIVLPKKHPKTITLEDLENYVQRLAVHYPERNFDLKKIHLPNPAEEAELKKRIEYYQTKLFRTPIDTVMLQRYSQKLQQLPRKLFYIITQKASPRVPIYVDLETQTFYIPKTYLKRKRKLTNYILMRTLGALGISQSKYYRGGG